MFKLEKISLSVLVALAMTVTAVPAFASEPSYTQDPNVIVINNSDYISAQEIREVAYFVGANFQLNVGVTPSVLD